ncbi:MAG: GHKL domain-containing protein [Eubacteriales bacterium]|nr:GHKL domain-containing protein [Eubacteriales bacterium]
MQWLLFLEVSICSFIFLINIIFGSLNGYPTEILLFNGVLIFSFAAANFLIFLVLYRTLQDNKRLELKTQEQEKLTEYMTQLENHYQEIRRFKHDYINILSTLSAYIEENDMPRLSDYFERRIMPSRRLLLNKDETISRLSFIKVLEIKGLLYTKLIQAMNLDLNVTLELRQEITRIPMNLLTLTRILGIFLDNAMEAAVLTKERRVHVAIIPKDGKLFFHIENSSPPPAFPLEKLAEPGVSTKANHSGLGLSTVRLLLESVPCVQQYTVYENGTMKQILELSEEAQKTERQRIFPWLPRENGAGQNRQKGRAI